MKNLMDFVNESSKKTIAINESRLEIDECRATGNMKYGFMRYDDNRGIVEVFQFNKLNDFAKLEGFSEDDYGMSASEMYMDIDKLEVGDSVYDGAAMIYTRIW